MNSRAPLLAAALLAALAALPVAGALAQQAAPAATTAAGPAVSTPTEQAGSAVLAVGSVTDTSINGSVRQLADGDPIYSGDHIVTGDDSYADLDFEDGGRMLLRPDTDFQIQQFHYDPAAHGYTLAPPAEPSSYAQTAPAVSALPSPATAPPPAESAAPSAAPAAQAEHESAFFRLLKGGFRAISGFIGHIEHQDYAVETPVATIGIRGTGYELRYCAQNCPVGEQGLYTGVGKGAISVRNQAGEQVTTAGHFGYVQSRHALFRPLTRMPRALANMRLPARYRARDLRNFRRLQQQRRRRWRRLAAQRGHRFNNPRGLRPGAHRPPAGYPGPRGAELRGAHASQPRAPVRKRKRHPPVRRRHGRIAR